MGESKSLVTGHTIQQHGIYQSDCGCRTALTLLVGQTLPRCLGCDETVHWRLVQEVRPSSPPGVRSTGSTTRLRAAAHRAPLKSASGED